MARLGAASSMSGAAARPATWSTTRSTVRRNADASILPLVVGPKEPLDREHSPHPTQPIEKVASLFSLLDEPASVQTDALVPLQYSDPLNDCQQVLRELFMTFGSEIANRSGQFRSNRYHEQKLELRENTAPFPN